MSTPGRWWRTTAVGYYPPARAMLVCYCFISGPVEDQRDKTQGWAGPGAGWLERMTAPDVCARLDDPMLIVGQICPRALHDASRRKWHPVVMLRRGEPDLLPSFLGAEKCVRIHVCNTSLRVCRYLGSTTTIRRSLSRSLSFSISPVGKGLGALVSSSTSKSSTRISSQWHLAPTLPTHIIPRSIPVLVWVPLQPHIRRCTPSKWFTAVNLPRGVQTVANARSV